VGIGATHFIQTKYVKDWNDDVFFNDDGIEKLRTLTALGADIGSHSVAHSSVFNRMAVGSGDERYPAYVPFVRDRETTENATVLGELRVSKFLIENFIGGAIHSFRPGHLRNPYQLPQALAATGFHFSSSTTANNSLTHLPFQLTYNRENAAAVDVFEFPVTIEDQESPKLIERLEPALRLAHKISRYGGICVVLIHPDVIAGKLEFERRFVAGVRDFSWFGSMDTYGKWWELRNAIQIDVQRDARRGVITLQAPGEFAGIALDVPANWKFESATPGAARAVPNGNRLVVAGDAGASRFYFTYR